MSPPSIRGRPVSRQIYISLHSITVQPGSDRAAERYHQEWVGQKPFVFPQLFWVSEAIWASNWEIDVVGVLSRSLFLELSRVFAVWCGRTWSAPFSLRSLVRSPILWVLAGSRWRHSCRWGPSAGRWLWSQRKMAQLAGSTSASFPNPQLLDVADFGAVRGWLPPAGKGWRRDGLASKKAQRFANTPLVQRAQTREDRQERILPRELTLLYIRARVFHPTSSIFSRSLETHTRKNPLRHWEVQLRFLHNFRLLRDDPDCRPQSGYICHKAKTCSERNSGRTRRSDTEKVIQKSDGSPPISLHFPLCIFARSAFFFLYDRFTWQRTLPRWSSISAATSARIPYAIISEAFCRRPHRLLHAAHTLWPWSRAGEPSSSR